VNARRVLRTRGRIQATVRRLYLAPSPIDGTGAFARTFIPRGSYVTRCQGVLLHASEVTDDMRAMQVGPATYLANTPGTSTIDDFLNHSCNPNVGFQDGSLALYALRDIQAGDEVVFDYSTCMNERGWWIRCRCRVARCRNRVTSFCDLPVSEQRRLEPIALAYLRPCGRANVVE
jgi:SET domain-containing protein